MAKLTGQSAPRVARQYGWDIRRGSRHWLLRHPLTGETTAISFGSTISIRNERNLLTTLRNGSRKRKP